MISATERKWNSATTLYIARKIEAIAQGRKLKILDMGCGEGIVMEQLLEYGHDFYGYDLETRFEALKKRLGGRLGDDFDQRFRVARDERSIPFDDATFDVIYANQVFEHVRFLDSIFAESARVLKPGGVLITLFPLATYPVELHVRIPFVHWIPPGRLRVAYMRMFYLLRLRGRVKGMDSRQSALYWESFLNECCFYRFYNEIQALAGFYFEMMESDAEGYIRAKIDLLKSRGGFFKRMFGRMLSGCNGPELEYLITHGFGATFVIRKPRAERETHPSSAAYRAHLKGK